MTTAVWLLAAGAVVGVGLVLYAIDTGVRAARWIAGVPMD